MAEDTNIKLTLPLLVARGLVVYPSRSEAIEAGRACSIAAVDNSRKNNNSLIFVTSQKDKTKTDIEIDDIYEYGTLCRIGFFSKVGDNYRIRVKGSKRIKFSNIRFEEGTFVADGEVIEDFHENEAAENALVNEILKQIKNDNFLFPNAIPSESIEELSHNLSATELCDWLSENIPFNIETKIALLKEPVVEKRLATLNSAIALESGKADIEYNLEQKVRESSEKAQKEYFLREKMKAIRSELGEDDTLLSDEDEILKKLEENPYPKDVKERIKKELKRFKMMPEASLEASLIMNYIDVMMNVPWYEVTEDNMDLGNVRKILDEDHFGLEKVKERIIEYLAVKKETGNLKAPILCFYGPPGCGKTSLGKSIARALDREFFKASLGGIGDEAEIRGHRRTYVGSMPGRIIQGMTKAGTINPVFLLDEIDKLGGASYKGDPSSAMLEVLDPEQNFAFNDNYLEEPYDLSNVLFICTANNLSNIPGPLRDRLELIEVPSYTEIEKIRIAEGFLIPKQMENNGVKDGDVEFTKDGIKTIIEFYTREAGVRQLERLIASCCRKAIVKLIDNPEIEKPIIIDNKKVIEYLGITIFEDTKKEKEPQVGVVTGLAYTDFGGDILPMEVTYYPGKGNLVLTGSLGDVMKESSTIAVSYVRANAKKYGIKDDIFEKNDIHIHFPEGAVPKDGPSAGIAITLAIISCLTNIEVNNNVAMTGETTLRGRALPIGGLREKSLAALRCGIKKILVPIENNKDIDELPKEVKENLEIVKITCVDDAIKQAFMTQPTPRTDD